MKFFIAMAVGLLLFADAATAQSDLLITPHRVVFETGERIKEVSVVNTGRDTARYLMSFVQYKMTDLGRLEQISEPLEGQMFADRYVRMFPRAVVLPPNEAQLVRLQLRAPSDLAEGEYRSHLYFRSEAHRSRVTENDEAPTEGLGVRLIPIYGITIPVIFRVGDTSFEVDVEGATVVKEEAGGLFVELEANRRGNQSAFGNIEVFHSNGGEETKVAEVRGVAIYTPNDMRIFRIPLREIDGIDYSSGQLRIMYVDQRGQPREQFFNHLLPLD